MLIIAGLFLRAYDIIKIETSDNLLLLIIILLASMGIPLIVTFIISGSISRGILQLNYFLKNFFHNTKIPEDLIFQSERNTELSETYAELKKVMESYIDYGKLAEQLIQNDFTGDFSDRTERVLSKAMLQIREHLIAKEQEHKLYIRALEQNEWYRSGITEFNALLQKDFKNTEDMAYPVIKKIAEHLQVEQSGFFILKNDLLVLEAAYAYDKKKLLDTQFEIGESLVGKCAKEGKIIYITDLPEGYAYIGSGLGENSPKTLMLIPLIYENELCGVIEIASLKRIADYKRNFLKIIAERIAAELSGMNVKISTSKLVEDAQRQLSEQVRKTEKTVQDLAEITEEKEQLLAENQELTERIGLFGSYLPVVIFSPEGSILSVNKAAEQLYNINNENVQNKAAETYFHSFKDALPDLLAGKTVVRKIPFPGKTEDVFEKYIPVKDENNTIEKIFLTSFIQV